jgi:hypothetical protein
VGSGARAAGLGSSIRNITNSTAGGGIRAGARAAGPRPRGEVYRQSFSDMLPYDEFVDEDRIREMAYSRVDPEIERQRAEALRALMAQISQGGTYRFGRAPILQQQLMDMYGRRREEMALPFMQAGQQTLGDYYNTLESEYYRDPLNFGVPTQFDYSKILGF